MKKGQDFLEENSSVIYGAIYARYSSDMQSSNSARDQIERIKYLMERNQIPSRLYHDARIKLEPQWIIADEAITGKIAGRLGYQTILEGIRQKSFQILIVDDLSRLTRSLGNLLDLYDMLKHHDIELVSVTDRVSSADPNARTFFTFKGMVADFGNEAHAGRTIRGLQSRAIEGFSAGQRPYGYSSEATKCEIRKGKEVKSHFRLFINPQQAEVIRRIFQLYSEGYGKVAIAKTLNQESVPPPSSRSSGWQIGPIDKILNYEKYIGRWIYGRYFDSRDPETGKTTRKQRPRSQWIVQDREDLRIIPQDLWDEVQKRREENREDRKVHQPNTHEKIFGSYDRIDNRRLLSGVMACPKCFGTITLVSGRRDGYYGCLASYRKGDCNWRVLIRRNRVESAVLDYLKSKLLSNDDLTQHATQTYNEVIKKHLRQAPSRKKELEQELATLEKEIENLVSFITKGQVSNIDAISDALRKREDRKSNVKQQLADLTKVEDKASFLVTPYLVKHKLESVMNSIEEAGDKYCALLSQIFEGPLVPHEVQGGVLLKGTLNLGHAMRAPAGGSTHCTHTLPRGFEPRSTP